MKLRSITLAIAACVAVFPALASDTPAIEPASEGTWSITSAVTSHDLFRGVVVGGESFQPSIDFSSGALALGLWSSLGLSDGTSGDSDPEFDFYGAYAFTSANEKWRLAPGFTLYTYPDANRGHGFHRATFEPNLSVSYTLSGIRFTPTVYHDFTLRGTTLELTADLALPLTRLGTELEFAATIGTYQWDDVTAGASPAEKNWGDYWTLGVAMPFTVSARSSVRLGVLYSEGHDNFYKQGRAPKERNPDAIRRTAVTLSYTVEL